MRKINILEFTHQREWGGTDKSSQLMLEHYNRDKFDIFAASYEGGPRAQWLKNNHINHLISNDTRELIDWIKLNKIDAVHFYRGGWTEPRDIEIFKKANVPVLIERNCFADFDGSDQRELIDIHAFCSLASLNIYKGRSGVYFDPSKCVQLYVPTDIDIFKNIQRDYNQPIFGRLSRKDPSKWHRINVDSLPLIKEVVPEAKFYVVGMPDEYRDLAKQMGVQDMIVEFPSVADEQLVDFFSKITVFAHSSSIGESFGNAMAEAMASGLPVVTHTGWDSAQTELCSDKYNGFVVDPSDTEGYARAVIELLQNPDKKQFMGQLSKDRAADWFEARKVVRQFEDLFIAQYIKKGVV